MANIFIDNKFSGIPNLPMSQAHCDSRICHAPKECEYCDEYPQAQTWRAEHKICYTGHQPPDPTWTACPADTARPPGATNDHRRWAGNKPTGATGNPNWPQETLASQIMYGDHGGRHLWPYPERIRHQILRPARTFGYWLKGYQTKNGYRTFTVTSHPKLGTLGNTLGHWLIQHCQ